VGELRARHALPESASLPAERFRVAGYRTAGIYRNGWVADNFGFAQGFEIYMVPNPPGSVRRNAVVDPAAIAGSDGDVIRAATGFLESHARDRWFLYLHLLDELDSLGLRERTIVVLASDHGEAFGEHGKDGHAFDVYGEVTDVPFVVSLPFRLEPGVVVTDTSENVDVWPTILDLMGMSPLEGADGVSRLPEIEAGVRGASPVDADDDPGAAIAHLELTWAHLDAEEDSPMVSVTKEQWRLLYRGEDAPLELYDKEADPLELRNVASAHADVAEDLSKAAEGYLQRNDSPWASSAPIVEIDEMELNQLRALGYGVQ
jgi:arylsulfatase A-like enzyme